MSTHITTHVEDARARLSWQFVDKAQLCAFLSAFTGRVQLLEDVAQAVAAGRYLDDAAGLQLDRVGGLVGQARLGGPYPNGEADALYRRKIAARIAVNASCGTLADLHAIARALWPTATIVHETDAYPAAFVLAVGLLAPATSDETDAFIEFVTVGKAAGVGIDGLATYTAPVFGFSEDPDPAVGTFDDGTLLAGAGTWAAYIYP